MKRLIPLTGALVLAVGASNAALAQNGNGNAHGNGKGNGGNHGQQDRGGERGGGAENRGGGSRAERGEHGAPQGERRAEVRMPDVARDVGRGPDRRVEREVRRVVEGRNGGDGVLVFRRDADRGLLNGCPPGLAKRNNGCLPPGQERQIDRAAMSYDRYNYLWRSFGGDGDYRYRDGYLYRTTPQGGLLGYIPVLGGILSPGNTWPSQYGFQQPPPYYSRYYGLNDQYGYRYADGVLYGVDPKTQRIGQVAALLTGQQFNVGQRLPAGYDIYNVPYPYRSRYVDSAQRQYRYNDGYIYQVDPTTQLVQAAIQLLT